MVKDFFKRTYHFLRYTVTFLLLFLSISAIFLRISLPGIERYHQQTQKWVTQYIGYSVSIEDGINASWNGWNPSIRLSKINILDPETGNNILYLKSAHINIDLFKSLFNARLIPKHVTISGLDITLILNVDKSISIVSKKSDQISHNTINKVLGNWLGSEGVIFIKNSQIALIDLGLDENPILLSDISVSISHDIEHIKLDGYVKLPSKYGEEFSFSMRSNGNILKADWSAQLYIEAEKITPLILSHYKIDNISNISGDPGKIKIWSEWLHGEFHSVQGYIDFDNIFYTYKGKEESLKSVITDFSVKRNTKKNIEIIASISELSTDNGIWPKTEMIGHIMYRDNPEHYYYTGYASYLNLSDILPIVTFTDDNLLSEYKYLSGQMNNFLFKFDSSMEDLSRFYIDSEFSNIEYHGDNYKITDLEGSIEGFLSEGNIIIKAGATNFSHKKIFPETVSLYQLNTSIHWEYFSDRLILKTDLLDGNSDDFDFQFSGRLNFEDEKIFSDSILKIKNINIQNIYKYSPTNFSEAIKFDISGNISFSDIIIRGWLHEFPFEENTGNFRMLSSIEGDKFIYNKKWPPIKNFSAELSIDNNDISFAFKKGKIYNADIRNVDIFIPNINSSIENIQVISESYISGDIEDLVHFIKNSPLGSLSSLKKLLKKDIGGKIDINIFLNIPISSDKSTIFRGDIALRNGFIDNNLGVKLTHMDGLMQFSNDSMKDTKIKAKYDGYPVTLNIEKETPDNYKYLLTGKGDNNFIIKQLVKHFPSLAPLKKALKQNITGMTEWQVSTKTDAKIVEISSSLGGLVLSFPQPLFKSAQEIPLKVTIDNQNSDRQNINFEYGKIASGTLLIEKGINKEIESKNLVFGRSRDNDQNISAISANVNISDFQFLDWWDFLKQDNKEFAMVSPDYPVSLDLAIDSLDLFNIQFDNISVKIKNSVANITIDMLSKDIEGSIMISNEIASDAIIANLDKLYLVEKPEEQENNEDSNQINPGDIPPLKINIADFRYNDMVFGEATIKTVPIENGTLFDEIFFKKTGVIIKGNGSWYVENGKHISELDVILNASTLQDMLSTFNYDNNSIDNAKTAISLQANWDGTLMDFSLEKLQGKLKMEIDQGHLKEVDHVTGRLFGLLSVQMIFRRIFFDFNDIFAKGLTFDDIEGYFDIDQGNAYTNNLSMTAPSVNMVISGRVGLVDQDYDQIATVFPRIADTLPIASIPFGPIGWGVGTAILFAGKVFEEIPRNIDKILRKQYTITGSWDDPKVQEYSDTTVE